MMTPSKDIIRLLEIMAALRDPKTGCPWDIEQNFASISPYTIEEAYEVADAIERGDKVDLCDELGDLLLQVVYHARMAEEEGSFAFGDVVEAVTQKMIRRHPHVFGDKTYRDVGTVNTMWQHIKAEEKTKRQQKRAALGLADDSAKGFLGKVKTALPATKEAIALQQRAAEVGFDWAETPPIFDKIKEELKELAEAVQKGDQTDIEEEFGDLYFALMNMARRLKIEPESALRHTNAKFRNRFSYIENNILAQSRQLEDASLEEMEALWQQAKEHKA